MRVYRKEKIFLFEDIERVAEFALKDGWGFNKQTQQRRSFQGEKKVKWSRSGKMLEDWREAQFGCKIESKRKVSKHSWWGQTMGTTNQRNSKLVGNKQWELFKALHRKIMSYALKINLVRWSRETLDAKN